VLLTPLLVLAVVLLLGFAGCLEAPPPPEPPGNLSIRVRVPTALTVTRLTSPDGTPSTITENNPAPDSTEDGDDVFLWQDGTAVDGAWTVGCQVEVMDANGNTDMKGAEGNPILDGTIGSPTADFLAVGTPSDGDFDVAFQGVS